MTWPTPDVITTNCDAGTDSPATFRTDVLDLITKFNQMRAHVSAFMQGLLANTTAAAARATLLVAPRATRVDVASVAGTVDLTASSPDTDDIQITGALAITAFTVAIGRVMRVRAAAAHSLANNASIVTQTGATVTCVAGDSYMLRATAANVVEVLNFTRASDTGVTQAVDNNTTKVATTAFVLAQSASATPLIESGAGAVGTSTRFARGDHVHPASAAGVTSLNGASGAITNTGGGDIGGYRLGVISAATPTVGTTYAAASVFTPVAGTSAYLAAGAAFAAGTWRCVSSGYYDAGFPGYAPGLFVRIS